MPCSQGRFLVVLEPSLLPLLQVFSAAARGPSPPSRYPRNQTPGFFIQEPEQAKSLRRKAPFPTSSVAPWHGSVSAPTPHPRPLPWGDLF